MLFACFNNFVVDKIDQLRKQLSLVVKFPIFTFSIKISICGRYLFSTPSVRQTITHFSWKTDLLSICFWRQWFTRVHLLTVCRDTLALCFWSAAVKRRKMKRTYGTNGSEKRRYRFVGHFQRTAWLSRYSFKIFSAK